MQPNFFFVTASRIGFDDFGMHKATCGTQAEAETIARNLAASDMTRWTEVVLIHNDALDIKTHGCLQETVARYQGASR